MVVVGCCIGEGVEMIDKSDKQEIRWRAMELWNIDNSLSKIRSVLKDEGYDEHQFHYVDFWVKQWDRFFYRHPKSEGSQTS